MNAIDTVFHRLRAAGRKALIAFLPAGDPSLDATALLARALAQRGASLIEIGFPYSDPLADGPVIQASYTRALARGVKLADVFALARRIADLLSPTPVALDEQDWGLDHGTWSVLRHLYPDADIPVVQLSIDESQPALFHYELGRKLAPLREEGVLIAGSGNLVHNLHAYAWGRHLPDPYDWAVRFEKEARELLLAGDHMRLVQYEALGRAALLSIPTPDHYLPLLYVIGARQQGEPVIFPVEGMDGGSISMLAAQVG